MFEMQVRLEDCYGKKTVFRSVRPIKGEPYQFETESEAQAALDKIYPNKTVNKNDKRVIPVR